MSVLLFLLTIDIITINLCFCKLERRLHVVFGKNQNINKCNIIVIIQHI